MDIKDYFNFVLNENTEEENIITYKDHGRIERIEHYIVYDIEWLYGKEKLEKFKYAWHN